MSDACGERHPTRPSLACATPGTDHVEHTAWDGELVWWPNDDYITPLLPEERGSHSTMVRIALEAGRRLSAPRTL